MAPAKAGNPLWNDGGEGDGRGPPWGAKEQVLGGQTEGERGGNQRG